MKLHEIAQKMKNNALVLTDTDGYKTACKIHQSETPEGVLNVDDLETDGRFHYVNMHSGQFVAQWVDTKGFYVQCCTPENGLFNGHFEYLDDGLEAMCGFVA
jgi:hypothetical protein